MVQHRRVRGQRSPYVCGGSETELLSSVQEDTGGRGSRVCKQELELDHRGDVIHNLQEVLTSKQRQRKRSEGGGGGENLTTRFGARWVPVEPRNAAQPRQTAPMLQVELERSLEINS